MTGVRRPLAFRIRLVPPFRLDLTAWALRRRARNLIDRWDGSSYRRVLAIGRQPTEIVVRQTGSPAEPRLRVTTTPAPEASAASTSFQAMTSARKSDWLTGSGERARSTTPASNARSNHGSRTPGMVYFHLLLDGLMRRGELNSGVVNPTGRSR